MISESWTAEHLKDSEERESGGMCATEMTHIYGIYYLSSNELLNGRRSLIKAHNYVPEKG